MRALSGSRSASEPQRFLLATFLLALSLMWPAVINGAPILYPDSVGYYRSGEAGLMAMANAFEQLLSARGLGATISHVPVDTQGDGVSSLRSIYYGTLVASLYMAGGTWLVVLAQSFCVALTIVIALRAFAALYPGNVLAVGLALALPSGLAVFTSAIMPDVFAGAMLLSMALLLVCYDRLLRWERVWLFGVTAAAILFHKSHLLISAGTLLLGLALLHGVKRRALRPALILGVILVISAGAHGIVSLVVQRVTGETPVSTPFILARLIGDGTAVDYLKGHCPEQRLVSCEYLARMPMSENQFLWSRDPATGAFGSATIDRKLQILEEERSIALGTVAEFPLRQIMTSSGNAVRQFLTAGVTEFRLTTGLEPEKQPGFSAALESYKESRIYRRDFPLPFLSLAVLVTYLASLAIVGLAGARWMASKTRTSYGESRPGRDMVFASLIVVSGIVVNAVVCGVFSGVFDRYQGRVAWLMPLFAILALQLVRQAEPGWRKIMVKG